MRTIKWDSPYYPPRARWYAPIFDVGARIRRRTAFDRMRWPMGVSPGEFLGGLLVPGLGFYAQGSRLLGHAAVASCALLISVFIVWLGYPAANWAFGFLLSIHASGIIRLLEPWLAGVRLGKRVLMTFLVLFLLGSLVYLPARSAAEHHLFMPLHLNGRVVVIRSTASPRAVHRGDWIAYSLSDQEIAPNTYMRAGYGLGPVFGLPGDRVRFSESSFEVNGIMRARLRFMPSSGELLVVERHWFVWPDFDIVGGHGYVPENVLPGALLQMATISEDQLIGKPCKRWFWRRQLSS
jgi:hypothetical protein